MATPSQSRAVKSLNTSGGRKRFIFKNFDQKIEEIDISEKVFRSLDPVKAEPSSGSSFFRDCLIEYRELNTAEDFISFYEEMMPWVQTLPQVLLHKDTIISKLLARLKVTARLSLEPILRLIAALSQDLLKDFLPSLKKVADALVNLLENGAEREPEVLEQIFTSWSYIMMHLKKYLMLDITALLKITRRLRYYPQEYVQEFMAESISFLLRNAPDTQLKKGIMEITQEVVKNPSHVRKSGASALLWYVMKGSSSKFHSRADRVLRLLMSGDITDTSSQGVEVVTATFQRLCEELHPDELKLMWNCLFDEISSSVNDGSLLHLGHVLSIVTSSIQFCSGVKFFDYQPMLDVVKTLMQNYVRPDNEANEDQFNDIVEKLLHLMLCVLDGLVSSSGPSAIFGLASKWDPVFSLRNQYLLTFIRGLVQKDPCVSDAFRDHILSAINNLAEFSSSEEIIYVMVMFFEKLRATFRCFVELPEERFPRIYNLLREPITEVIKDIECKDLSNMQYSESKLAGLWGILSCYAYLSTFEATSSLIMELVNALDQLPITEIEKVAGVSSCTWQSLLGAALASYHKLQLNYKSTLGEQTQTFLNLAQKYKSSSNILFAVAEFLDSIHGHHGEADSVRKTIHPELIAEKSVNAINVFSDNVGLPDSGIRISTLKILSNYESLEGNLSESDEPAQKKIKTEACHPLKKGIEYNNVIQILLTIEMTPLSITTSNKIILLISQIQMALSAGRIAEDYIPLLLNGIISIFHKRFSQLWMAAQECLAILLDKYVGITWDKFVGYLEKSQLQFLTSDSGLESKHTELPNNSSDLLDSFKAYLNPTTDSTPCTTVVSCLLKSLQKVHSIAESKSRRLVPLFLTFLGYSDDSMRDCNVGSFVTHPCKGKEWRGVLKEWLNLLVQMRNPRSLYRSHFLKEVLIKRLLDQTDSEIQLVVLDCLLNWKDDFLLPYSQHLRNLVTSKNLREELAIWTLDKESHQIEDLHREYLIPIVIRLLLPKVRNLKTLGSRKHASVHHRRAILCFMAQLENTELLLFFVLLIKPLQSTSYGTEGLSKWVWSSCEISLDEFQAGEILQHFPSDKLVQISWKKKYGFLHVFEDIFKSFDEFHLKPFLNLFMGLVVRILESCMLSLDGSKWDGSSEASYLLNENTTVHTADTEDLTTVTNVKQVKDQRSLCLKIISLVLDKFGHHDFGCSFWDIFFTSVKTLIEGFKQEGASSERPSSLFSCFLAMSRSHTLVSLLLREGSLIPSVFSVLTVKSASSTITVSVLEFIENLLNLDSDSDNHQDLVIKSVLLPNLGALINSLHCYFQFHSDSQRKTVKWPGKAELRIFKLLSNYINESVDASKFVDILLPFLSKKAQNSEECSEVLRVIQVILPRLRSTEASGKILNAIAHLLISAGLDIRLSICDLLDSLTTSDPSVTSLAKLVHDLNAVSLSELDELDYDTRVNAYEKVDHKFFSTLREDHALVILSHAVYDMSSEELILRQSAYRLFLSFVHFSAIVLGCEGKSGQDMPEPTIMTEAEPCWTKACIHRLVKKFFLKYMGESMNKGISVRREWISLLRDMVLKIPQMPFLNSIKELCSKDPEVDFFDNILHLQIHRRAKALARFRKAIGAGNFSEIITKKVFVPLFFKMLFDVEDGKQEHLRNACLESLASISGHMQWESYHAFLLRCFREMTLKPDQQKILLRLICHVLDHFHFTEASINQEADDNVNEIINPGANEMSSTTLYAIRTVSSSEIQALLQKTVLPKIQRLLSNESDKVNVTINLASLKLLKLLPVDTMESQLPSIIHRICNFLKNHMVSIRDEAREALVACSKELGLEYLHFIVNVLRATLKRGYQMHVLGYTLNFILSKALRSPSVGKLDYCLEELLSIAENDILGDVSEEKEVEKIASKMKETKIPKSFGTLKLIAQNATFKTHASKLLLPVKAHLLKHMTPKLKAKLEKMLKHIAEGIMCNPSVCHTDLFVFVYGLIEDGIMEENPQSRELLTATSNEPSKTGLTDKLKSSPWLRGYKSQSSHLVTVFALRVLQNRLKSMKLDKKDEQLLSMLDPFVELLGDCLRSKFEDVLSAALGCLGTLIRLPLPALESHTDKIKLLLLDIAQRSGNTNSSLLQQCLSLLTVLLQSSEVTLSSDQLHMMIHFPIFIDLERNPSSEALKLLKAIVGRKLVAPEIFDIVTRVAELMVTNQGKDIRKRCSQILLRFLIHYPISSKRFEQHLGFLLSNLSYEHSDGREAVLEMLHVIIVKSPKQIDDEQAQTLFIHFVRCLANDQDSKVRSLAGAVLKLLIGRISQSALSSIIEFSVSWYVGEDQNLWSAAAQVLGLLVEVLKEGFRRQRDIIPVIKRILKSSLDIVEGEQPKYSNEALNPFWRKAYYSLVLLEKLLLHFPELYFAKDIEDIWDSICEFLLSRHMWIRNISSRLVFSYFSAVSEASAANSEKLKSYLLMKPSRLFSIAVSLCGQLKAQLTDDVANRLITQNLVFAICHVHSLLRQNEFFGLKEFWSALAMHEQGHFVKAFQLLGSRKGAIMLASLSGESFQNVEDSVKDLHSLLVSPLLKRLGKVALQTGDIQMKIVFDCFRAISSQIGQEGCQQYAYDVLFPLYKVCEGYAGKIISDDVKQLAVEACDSIRDILGFENYMKVWSEIRKDVKAKRDKRKQKVAIMPAVDQQRNAKRKLRNAAKHRAYKKRKIMSMKKWKRYA